MSKRNRARRRTEAGRLGITEELISRRQAQQEAARLRNAELRAVRQAEHEAIRTPRAEAKGMTLALPVDPATAPSSPRHPQNPASSDDISDQLIADRQVRPTGDRWPGFIDLSQIPTANVGELRRPAVTVATHHDQTAAMQGSDGDPMVHPLLDPTGAPIADPSQQSHLCFGQRLSLGHGSPRSTGHPATGAHGSLTLCRVSLLVRVTPLPATTDSREAARYKGSVGRI